MAAIANTAFEARITNGHFNESLNITGRFQTGGADDVCAAGFLCVRGDQLPVAGFASQNLKNENAFYMTAAPATATITDLIYASNTYDWSLVSAREGVDYAIGINTLGLPIPAGREGTFTQIEFDGKSVYRFGAGNVNGDVGSNTFFTIADGLLVPAASAPTANGAIYFELRGSGNFTEGATASYGYYDVVACTVVA